MARQKVTPIPNIDLGGRFRIIDDTGIMPKWKTLERGFATVPNAQKVIQKYGLQGVWIFDDAGYQTYVAA
jgi:hypothetical protein